MTTTIMIVCLALIWLGYETKWLTIRLPRFYIKTEILEGLEAVLAVTPLLILISFIAGAVITGFFGIKASRKKHLKKPILPWYYRWPLTVWLWVIGWWLCRESIKSMENIMYPTGKPKRRVK